MANEKDVQAALAAAREAEDEARRIRAEAEREAERLRDEARHFTEEAAAIANGRAAWRRHHTRERRRIRHEWRWQERLTLKASATLATIAVWVAAGTAVAVRSGAWPILIFASLTTMLIGANAWRRLGLSRLVAITGIWAGTAVIAAVDDAAAWPALFALFTTAAVVFGSMRKNAWLLGLAIAAPWLAAAAAVGAQGGGVAWMVVIAFCCTIALANTRKQLLRGVPALAWWNLTGVAVVLGGPAWAPLAFGALILAWFPIGSGPWFTRGFEWDLWQNDRGPRSSTTGSNNG
ncbi:MAG: hypothetical protein AB7N24_05855 [Dehalococcoidia bacterium]